MVIYWIDTESIVKYVVSQSIWGGEWSGGESQDKLPGEAPLLRQPAGVPGRVLCRAVSTRWEFQVKELQLQAAASTVWTCERNLLGSWAARWRSLLNLSPLMILSWLNFQLLFPTVGTFGPWSRQLSLLLEVVLLQRGDAVPLGLLAVFSLTELG